MSTAKKWSYKTGEKGRNRVRAFEREPGEVIWLEFYQRESATGELRRKRVSTKHRDRDRAKAQADRLAAEYAESPSEQREGTTLRELFDKYLSHRTPHVGERQQKHHRRCAEMFCRYLGWDRKAATLNRKDWDRLRQDRAVGCIDARGKAVPSDQAEPVAARTVKRDLQTLRAALDWAVGADLLDHNPCAKYPYPRVQNQHRPRISQKRYERMLAVAGDVDWRMGLALVLAHETGHRIGAIRHLRWSDVDLGEKLVRWRSETDKTRRDHVTPLTQHAVEALRGAQEHRAAIAGAWVLPSPSDSANPVSRYLMRDWWYRVEEAAGLEHVPQLGWHGFRRKFADDLRHVPLKDLADAGGWDTPRTIIEVYQGTSVDAMRQALAGRRANAS